MQLGSAGRCLELESGLESHVSENCGGTLHYATLHYTTLHYTTLHANASTVVKELRICPFRARYCCCWKLSKGNIPTSNIVLCLLLAPFFPQNIKKGATS